MTKAHEEVFRGAVSEAAGHFDAPRGEFTIVVEGAGRPRKSAAPPPDAERVAQAMASARASGLSRRDAATQVARDLGVARRAAYAAGE